MNRALVSNIQRFSLDDGPGIRTTVFFKGCTLACVWCHNPECVTPVPSTQFFRGQCTLCGQCATACTQKAHTVTQSHHLYHRDKCHACGTCAVACRHGALKNIGTPYTPEELVQELLKDKHHFISSGGGVTFSGGEPAMYPAFVAKAARLCKEAELHVALDTAGNVHFANYEMLLPHVDLFLYDIKCFTAELHQQWTGYSNTNILENLWRLDKLGARYIIRVPIIPECNDDIVEQKYIANFITSLKNVELVELLPYHNYGAGKYDTLDLHNCLKNHHVPTQKSMHNILQLYKNCHLSAQIS